MGNFLPQARREALHDEAGSVLIINVKQRWHSVFLTSLKTKAMNIVKIVVALICSYALFISVAWLLMRILFPKIEVDDEEELQRARISKARALRRVSRPLRRQKNLAF